MSRNILIINYSAIFPVIMASQDRVRELARRLAKEHRVTVLTTYRSENEYSLNRRGFNEIEVNYIGVKSKNPVNSISRKLINFLKQKFSYYLMGMSNDYFYTTSTKFNRQVVKIIQQNDFEIVQLQYWFNWRIIKKLASGIIVAIDTQDILYDKRNQQLGVATAKLDFFQRRMLKKYSANEKYAYKQSHILISISELDKMVLSEISPNSSLILIPTGQDTKHYSEFTKNNDDKTILFYGGMGGRENVEAFWRLYNNIMPIIKTKIPDVKLLVVGSNPPMEVIKCHRPPFITITGYVQDVREWLSLATVMILPLNVAAGFRSRTVEVMSMRIPVVGTHKALDNLGMKNGEGCFISDENQKMADYAVMLCTDKKLLNEMGEKALRFSEEYFNIENTYGKLSDFYENYKLR